MVLLYEIFTIAAVLLMVISMASELHDTSDRNSVWHVLFGGLGAYAMLPFLLFLYAHTYRQYIGGRVLLGWSHEEIVGASYGYVWAGVFLTVIYTIYVPLLLFGKLSPGRRQRRRLNRSKRRF